MHTALDNASAITVLRAPQGYGKSAQVVDWLTERGKDASWHEVPHGAEAGTFWDGLLQTLSHDPSSTPAPPATSPSQAFAGVRTVLRDLDSPRVLVLDHFERIQSSEVETALAHLVEQCPSLTVVVCTRPVHGGQFLDFLGMDTAYVEGAALALSREEVGQLARRLGSPLTEDALNRIHDQLWGWPGPTRALLTASVTSPGTSAANLDIAALAPYFGDFPVTGNKGAEFLVRTLVLDTVTAETAAAVTQDEHAAERLATLEDSGLARSRLERGARVFRFLPILHTLPDSGLWPTVQAMSDEAHLRAAEVFQDQPEAAVRHAAAAQDWHQVVRIIDTSWVRLVTKHPARLRDVLTSIPGRFLNAMPRLLTVRDVLLHSRYDTITAQAIAWPEPGEQPTGTQVRDIAGVAVGQLIALRKHFQYQQAAALAARLTDACKDDEGRWRSELADALPFLLVQTGLARMVAGDLRRAHEDFLHCVRVGTGTPLEFLARHGGELAALVDAFRGNIRSAQERLEAAERLASSPTLLAEVVDPVAPMVRALLAVDQLDVAEAEAQLALLPEPNTVTHLRQSGWFFADGLRGIVRSLRGDYLGGIAALERARQVGGPRVNDRSMAGHLLASTQARLTLAAGNPTLAQNLITTHPGLGRDPVLRASLALHAGAPDDAVEIVTSGLWRTGLAPRERVALLLLDMQARDALGSEGDAATALRRAVECTSTDMLLPYAAVDHRLLARVTAMVPEAGPVLDALLASGLPVYEAAPTPLVELSERELAVLRELEDSGSAEVIARRLFVSVNTVKSQTRTLYRKLGVSARQGAVDEGFRLGFLDVKTPQDARHHAVPHDSPG